MKAKSTVRALALATLFVLVPAHADFHFMKIVEIFPGTAAAPGAQYIVLQMYAGGQQFVDGHVVQVFDATGAQTASFAFQGNVADGANQSRILIATQDAQAFFGISADLTMPAALLAAGGKVCFATAVDCVAWGGWSGSASGVGTPFNASGGLLPGRAAVRRLDRGGGASTLDASDDSNNCAVDFVFGAPGPRNNAGAFGSVPASTCGNDAIEGLEQCDDGNLAGGDGCSSTCAIDEVEQAPVKGDFDADGKADVFWRNQATGRNVIWRSADAGTPQSTTGVSGTEWEVVGIGDFDGDGGADAFWRHQGNGRNAIWLSGRIDTQQPTSRVSSLDWQVVGVGDFDGDGSDDAFWRNQATGGNAIWLSGQSGSVQATTGVTNLDWEVVGVGDFDGDGSDDAFWRNRSTGRNAIWLSGNAATQQPALHISNLAWQVVGVGDFDGDGNDDVFWRNQSTGRNAVWRSGDAATQRATASVSNLDWHVAAVGDFDGNGSADVFWRHGGNGRNAIWLSASASMPQAAARVSNLDWTIVP